jgi:hypothetical protein
MKILLTEFHPSGGLFQFSFQLGEALAASGHRVELVDGSGTDASGRTRTICSDAPSCAVDRGNSTHEW